MPFKSLDTVSYLPSIVTMAVSVAVCEIFSVKEWHDLENRVRVRSRSLQMAPFDRSHSSSYSPSIVTMALIVWYIASYWLKIAKFLYPTCIYRRDYITRGQSNLTKSASRGGPFPGQGSPQGVEICTIEFLGSGFLLVFHSNYRPRMHRLATVHARDNQRRHDTAYLNKRLVY